MNSRHTSVKQLLVLATPYHLVFVRYITENYISSKYESLNLKNENDNLQKYEGEDKMEELNKILFKEIVRLYAKTEVAFYKKKVDASDAQSVAFEEIRSESFAEHKIDGKHILYFKFSCFFFDANSMTFEIENRKGMTKNLLETCVNKTKRLSRNLKVEISDEFNALVEKTKLSLNKANENISKNIEISDTLKVGMNSKDMITYEVDDNYNGTIFKCSKYLEKRFHELKSRCEVLTGIEGYSIDQVDGVLCLIEDEAVYITKEEKKQLCLDEALLHSQFKTGNTCFWHIVK